MLQVPLQFLHKSLSAARVGIAAVHKTVYERLVDPVLFRNIAQLEQMIERTVHAAVRQQAHEMHLLAVHLRIGERLHDLRILQNRIVAAGPVDLHQILVYDASGADIQVTYFRITHLSVGKADVFAVGQQLRRRIFGLQAVDIDRVGRINHIVVAVIAFAPAVQNHQ